MYKEMGNLRATFISLFSQCRRGTIPFSPGVPFLFPECSLVLIACRLSGCHCFSSISLSFERSKGCTKFFPDPKAVISSQTNMCPLSLCHQKKLPNSGVHHESQEQIHCWHIFFQQRKVYSTR